MRTVWVRRLVTALGCAGIALGLLAGCGGDNPADKAFGGLSKVDEKALPEWSQHFRDVPAANIEVVRAFTNGSIGSADAAVTKYTSAVSRSAGEAKDFENAKLRTALTDYMAPFGRLGDAYRRAVTYFDAHPDAAENDPEAQKIVTEIQDAAAATRAADQTLIKKLTAVMSPDQRKDFLKQVNEEQRKYEQQATQAAGG